MSASKINPNFSSFLPITLLLISTLIPISESSIVEEACNAAASANGATYAPEFCIRALSAIPASVNANIQGLSVIATGLVMNNVTDILIMIGELLSNLNNCYVFYREMNSDLSTALGEIKQERIQAAGDKLGTVKSYPVKCNIQLSEGVNQKNPLSLENEYLNDLANMAYEITNLITNQGFN